jgi:hypothetical protein
MQSLLLTQEWRITTGAAMKLTLLAAGAFALLGSAAHAQLVLTEPVDFSGTGLGSVNTILTLQSPGNSTSETGAVAWNGSMDVITGDAKTGGSQTQTRTFADLGVTAASDLRVVFNALEPGNALNSIDLSSLTLNVYNATGATVFSASTPQNYSFADTFTGAGNSGFLFELTDASAAQLQSIFSSDLRVGLFATAANATGGFETFFVGNVASPVTPVPEPETYALMLAGLGVLGFVPRRRKQT